MIEPTTNTFALAAHHADLAPLNLQSVNLVLNVMTPAENGFKFAADPDGPGEQR